MEDLVEYFDGTFETVPIKKILKQKLPENLITEYIYEKDLDYNEIIDMRCFDSLNQEQLSDFLEFLDCMKTGNSNRDDIYMTNAKLYYYLCKNKDKFLVSDLDKNCNGKCLDRFYDFENYDKAKNLLELAKNAELVFQ